MYWRPTTGWWYVQSWGSSPVPGVELQVTAPTHSGSVRWQGKRTTSKLLDTMWTLSSDCNFFGHTSIAYKILKLFKWCMNCSPFPLVWSSWNNCLYCSIFKKYTCGCNQYFLAPKHFKMFWHLLLDVQEWDKMHTFQVVHLVLGRAKKDVNAYSSNIF